MNILFTCAGRRTYLLKYFKENLYEGDKIESGKKSYALNFVLQHAEKTLTDDETNKVMNKLIAAFEREVGAKLR